MNYVTKLMEYYEDHWNGQTASLPKPIKHQTSYLKFSLRMVSPMHTSLSILYNSVTPSFVVPNNQNKRLSNYLGKRLGPYY